MNNRLILGATLSSLFVSLLMLGSCAHMDRVPGPGKDPSISCTKTHCPPVVITVDHNCVVHPNAEIHVASDAGTDTPIKFILGQNASAFAKEGIVIKADADGQVKLNQLSGTNPPTWTLVDANTKHSTGTAQVQIQFGINVVDGNGINCHLDPYVINDM